MVNNDQPKAHRITDGLKSIKQITSNETMPFQDLSLSEHKECLQLLSNIVNDLSSSKSLLNKKNLVERQKQIQIKALTNQGKLSLQDTLSSLNEKISELNSKIDKLEKEKK